MAKGFSFFIDAVVIASIAIISNLSLPGQSMGFFPEITRPANEDCLKNETTYASPAMLRMAGGQFLSSCRHREFSQMKLECENNERLTCRHSCDDKSDWPEDKPNVCYCDAKCLMYDDCCYDFHEYCSDQKTIYENEIAPLLKNADITCVWFGQAFVSSCMTDYVTKWARDGSVAGGDSNILQIYSMDTVSLEDFDVNTSDEQANENFLHSLDLAVTDSVTGIHFINYTIFRCNQRSKESTAIFWRKVTSQDNLFQDIEFKSGDDESTAQTSMSPPDKIRPRYCHSFRISCMFMGPMCCQPYDVNIVFLCKSIVGYIAALKELSVIGDDTTKENVFEFLESVNSVSENKDVGNQTRSCEIESSSSSRFQTFSVLVTLNSDYSLSLVNTGYSAWEEAVCRGKVDRNHCSILKCKKFHYRLNDACMQLASLTVHLTYKQKKGNIFKSVQLTDRAWSSLDNSFEYDLEPFMADEGCTIIIVTKIWNNTVQDRNDHLPFIYGLLEESKKMLESHEIPPIKISVCASLIAPTATDTPYCDAIYPSHSIPADDWLIESNYVKNGPSFSGQEQNKLSFRYLVVLQLVIFFYEAVCF